MNPAGRPKLPPGRKAETYSNKLYREDIERIKRFAKAMGVSQAETIRRALDALEWRMELEE